MKFELKVKPISINKFFRGRHYITSEGKKYQQMYHMLLPKKKMIKGQVKVEIVWHIEKRFLGKDIDNIAKILIDAIVKKGLIEDDRFIVELNIKKVKADEDKIIVKIDEVK